jgi:hypothetical protein
VASALTILWPSSAWAKRARSLTAVAAAGGRSAVGQRVVKTRRRHLAHTRRHTSGRFRLITPPTARRFRRAFLSEHERVLSAAPHDYGGRAPSVRVGPRLALTRSARRHVAGTFRFTRLSTLDCDHVGRCAKQRPRSSHRSAIAPRSVPPQPRFEAQAGADGSDWTTASGGSPASRRRVRSAASRRRAWSGPRSSAHPRGSNRGRATMLA